MGIRRVLQVSVMPFLSDLKHHMLTQQRVAPPGAPRYTPLSCSLAPRRADAPAQETGASAEFSAPGGRDPLFWCFHIGLGEVPGLDLRQERNYQREQRLKVEGVERIRQWKNATTPSAKKKLQELESELTSRPFTRGNGLSALCDAYGKRVLYVSGRTCCFMGPPDAQVSIVIKRIGSRNSRKHEVYAGANIERVVEEETSARWCMEGWEKPIRGAGTYSVAELRTMAALAGLALTDENGKRLIKKAIYGALKAVSDQN